MARVPSVIRNFTLYRSGDATVFLGIGDIDLPVFTALTAELQGSGLAGKTDTVIPGHFSNLQCKVSLHTPDPEFIDLCYFDGDTLNAYGVIQGKDSSTGRRYASAFKAVMVIDGTKTATPGKLSVGAKSDSGVELTVTYVAYYIDGTCVLLYDFYNYIYQVNGIDYLAQDRTILGISN